MQADIPVDDTQRADTQRKVGRSVGAPGCPVHAGPDGVWHVQDHATAKALLRSTDTRQAGFGIENMDKMPQRMRKPVLYRDGAEHREHRRQTAKFFTPKRVDASYRELMERLAQRQCDELRRRGTADISALSFDLAVAVAAEVVGLTEASGGMAKRLDRFFTNLEITPGWHSVAGIRRMLGSNSTTAMFYWRDVRPSIAARRKERRDDLISHLIDEGCSDGEILGECVTFAAAGMITTREFITLVLWHLFTDDALRSAYEAGEEKERVAILHEILRLEPVVGNLARITTAEIQVPGADGPVTIPSGARLDIGVAAANLDTSAVGERPGSICPARPLAEGVGDAGLSFGDGPHRCPGAYIAIQETDIFVSKLLTLPGLRMLDLPSAGLRPAIASYEITGLTVAVD